MTVLILAMASLLSVPRSAAAQVPDTTALLRRIEAAETAVREDSLNPGRFSELGILYGQQGQPRKAEQAYRRAIAIDAGADVALNNLAWLLYGDGRLAEAAELSTRSLEAERTSREDLRYYLDTRANILLDAGQPREALELFDIVLLQSGDPGASAHFGRAMSLLELGRVNEAVRSYHWAVELDAQLSDGTRLRKNLGYSSEAVRRAGHLGRLAGMAGAPAPREGAGQTPLERADHNYARGVRLLERGTRTAVDSSITLLLRAASLYEAAGNVARAGRALGSLARTYRKIGDYGLARRITHDALTRQTRVGDDSARANSFAGLALIEVQSWYKGDAVLDSAAAHARAALELARRLGDLELESSALLIQAGLAGLGLVRSAGDGPYRGAALARAALDAARKSDDPRSEPYALNGVGYFVHRVAGRLDSARFYYRRAAELARIHDVHAAETLALGNLADLHRFAGRADSALLYRREALQASRIGPSRITEGDALWALASEFATVARIDSTLHYQRQALAVYTKVLAREEMGNVYYDQAEVYQALGRRSRARALFEKARRSFLAAGDATSVSRTVMNLSRLEASGLSEAIERHFRDPRFVSEDTAFHAPRVSILGGQITADSDSLAAAHQPAVQAGVQDRPQERADEVDLDAIDIDVLMQRLTGPSDKPDTARLREHRGDLSGALAERDARSAARIHRRLGAALARAGHADSALRHYDASARAAREAGDRRSEALALFRRGRLEAELGRHEQAGLTIERSRLLFARAGSTVGASMVDMQFSLLSIAEKGEALHPRLRAGLEGDARQLMIRTTLSHLEQDTTFSYIPASIPAKVAEAKALQALGERFYGAGGTENLLRSVAYFDSAAALRSRLAVYTGEEPDRLSFAEQDARLFGKWTLAWLGLEHSIGHRDAALGALAASERGRAQALLDLIRGAAEAARAGDDLPAEGARLVEPFSGTRTAALVYDLALDTLVSWLILPSGRIHVDRRVLVGADRKELFGQFPAEIRDWARRTVARDSLAWLVGLMRAALGADSAYVRAAGSDTAGLFRSRRVGRPTGTDFQRTRKLLGELLLSEDLLDRLPEIDELVIVPTGPLALVPFAALPAGSEGSRRADGDSADADTDAEETPLGLRVAVRYAPSLTILRELETRRDRAGPAGTGLVPSDLAPSLVIGNPTMPVVPGDSGKAAPLAPLPGAEAEAAWLADTLDARLLAGSGATETAIRSRLPAARLVHLATHGIAYGTDVRARESFVALAPDAQNDGILTVAEILDEVPSLAADLIVLSACQTGLGHVNRAEGVVGLQRALLAKGARSVLVSLWKVSDDATEALMRSFYRHWFDPETSSKADALRLAQAEVRNNPRWRHPKFWAAFKLVGSP